MDENERIPAILILGGPTASGKSTLAEAIALEYNIPIISADSRQIYRGMNIGTAKPPPEIQSRVRYEMIDIIDPDEQFSSGKFTVKAAKMINVKYRNEKIIILSGGTGFYIKALIDGLADIPEITRETNRKWDDLLDKKGILYLKNQIKKLDSLFYEKGDVHNPHRLLRALKIVDQTGRSLYDYKPHSLLGPEYHKGYFAMSHERSVLYDRIDRRVDHMIKQGLVNEVRSLLPYQETQAMKSVGYRELLPFLRNEISLDEAISKIKQHSRNYAKRQLTWMRKHGNWKWISPVEQHLVKEWVEAVLNYE